MSHEQLFAQLVYWRNAGYVVTLTSLPNGWGCRVESPDVFLRDDLADSERGALRVTSKICQTPEAAIADVLTVLQPMTPALKVSTGPTAANIFTRLDGGQ